VDYDRELVIERLIDARKLLVDAGSNLYSVAMEFCHVRPECVSAENANCCVHAAIQVIDRALERK
jgi:hypothetical protein